jgi:hypothetical protein
MPVSVIHISEVIKNTISKVNPNAIIYDVYIIKKKKKTIIRIDSGSSFSNEARGHTHTHKCVHTSVLMLIKHTQISF